MHDFCRLRFAHPKDRYRPCRRRSRSAAFSVEHAETFFVSTDDAVGQAVELVAGGVDGIMDQLDLRRIDPAAVLLKRGELGPYQIAARVVGPPARR